MTVVLKLGGSVITAKDEPETLDEAALDRALDAVAGAGDLVLVHGAGSFGHYHADRHGVSRADGTHDAAAAFAIHDSMRRLNDAIVGRLLERGVPALPVHPLSVGARDADGTLAFPTDAVRGLRGDGFVPVLHGDVIAHAGRGVTIVSGDEVVAQLARDLGADRVGLCSGVPGVLDAEGEVIPRIDSFASARDVLGGSDATDVTGGMAGKVRELLDLDAPAFIFDLDGLEAFLDGGSPGTRIE